MSELLSVALFAAQALRESPLYNTDLLANRKPSRFVEPGQAERKILKARRTNNKSARTARKKNRKK